MNNENDPLFRGKAPEGTPRPITSPRGGSGVTESDTMRIAKIEAASRIVAAAMHQKDLPIGYALLIHNAAEYLSKVF